MNTSWMFASTIVALLLVLAATALERVASLRRGMPLRWIWVAAMALAVGASASWLRTGAAVRMAMTSRAEVPAASGGSAAAGRVLPSPSAAPETIAGMWPLVRLVVARARPLLTLPRLPNSLEFVIRRLWLVASGAFLILLGWSAIRLWSDRRTWRAATVLDADVLVSDGFGPAIVGILRPAIVVPHWVLALDVAAQRTIVVHEEEHRRAGDPRLLLSALALLVLMPWNAGLWLMWRRLTRAVELDCDERVLARGVRGSDYANVLLGAWQRSRGAAWMPSPAFAERASGLGRRVEHLMRPEPRRRTMKTVTGSFVAVVLVAAAMVVPAPQGAQGVAVQDWGPIPLVLVDGVQRKDIVDVKTLQAAMKALMDVKHDSISLTQSVDSTNAVALYGPDGIHGAMAVWTKRYVANGGTMLPRNVVKSEAARRADPHTTNEEMASQIYARLFSGISLPLADEVKARAIILRSYVAQEEVMHSPELFYRPKINALLRERDEQLLLLLPTEAERVIYNAHVEQEPPRVGTTLREETDRAVFNYTWTVAVSDAERKRIVQIVEKSVIAMLDLLDRAPADTTARYALLAKRTADVRAVLDSDAKREAFDKRQEYLKQFFHRMREGPPSPSGNAAAASPIRSPRASPSSAPAARASAPGTDPAERAIVQLTSVGLTDVQDADADRTLILVWTTGAARVGIGDAQFRQLTDTLRLKSFPAMAFDVTDGEVHLRLDRSVGTMEIEAAVTGGLAQSFSASSSHITILRHGAGVKTDP